MTRRTKHKSNEGKATSLRPTTYERTRARQTGASIEQLRAEQRAAERMMKFKDAKERRRDRLKLWVTGPFISGAIRGASASR